MLPQCNDHKGVGAPVAHDVSSHRALKIQQNDNIWALIDVEQTGLQMNFSYFNKMTSFTNVITNVGKHKNSEFTKNKPEYLWPLYLWIKCNK